MALKQKQEKFQKRLRRAEKSYAEARWDDESKMWRRGIVDGLKLFPAITQGEETQGKKASCKTDKDSGKSKENKRSWEEEDDSDDEEFMDRLLHNRLPPYAVSDNAPSTSLDPGYQTQGKGVTDTAQTSDTASIQNGVSVPTAPDIPIQLQPPPQIQRIYPDVPVLETTTNLIVPADPICTETKLIQIESTPKLISQQQPQLIPGGGSCRVGRRDNGLESYTEAELRYLCPKITKEIEGEADRVVSTDRFVKLAKCLWEDLNTLFEIIFPPDLWLECKRGIDWPTKEPARDKVTGAPSEEVMKYYHKVIEFLKQKVSPKVTDWQKIDRTSQEVKESIHAYYERLLKAFKHYSGTETIELKDMNHLVFRFVEGLRPEVSQMIKNHLICWQAKPIDEVLQYAKYCSDEIELKQKKLKEKVMVMQIRAAQAGIQGNGVQQMIQQQPQMNGVFQTQPRGRGRGLVNRGSDMNTVVIQNYVQGAKKMSPCHACGAVGHWKRECPNMVQDGAVQQSTNVGAMTKFTRPKNKTSEPKFSEQLGTNARGTAHATDANAAFATSAAADYYGA
ncbi:hypothetical protein NDU88_004901 [Pleurodeles waltl]|uniref:CCHC-type domain-containing protein n=1 Tax=Pleurodeles waltl TaxID=8319 RepID=A0AAV7UHN8_PLEWA|nr:hypothetical protein NDU88_004901 [Pleurodeles waltl]